MEEVRVENGPEVTYRKVRDPDRRADGVQIWVKGKEFIISKERIEYLLGLVNAEVCPYMPWHTKAWTFDFDLKDVTDG